MSQMTFKTKFRIGTASILLLFCAGASTVLYQYLKEVATNDIYRETEIFISTADATRTYVKDVLRPRMTELLPTGAFIPHAMSTTFVGRDIMNRLQKRFPNFKYKRAASDPMNEVNQADDFELKMLKWFDANRDKREWHGLIKKNNRSFYTRLRAIYVESECLYCHGRPEDAPMAVKDLYGTDGGFYYKIGEVVAADTVYIPVDFTFIRIKEAAWIAFLVAIISLFALVGLFHILFNRTVVSELKGLLATFRGIIGGTGPTPEKETISSGDEFSQIKGAFESVAKDLQLTHDELTSSESKYRLLFESSQDAILIFDDKTRIIDINIAGIRMFGINDRAEALSIETYYQLFWDTRDAESFNDTIRKKGFMLGTEISMVDRGGRKLTIMISATQRLDEQGGFSGIDCIFRNVTEKRRVEKYLAQTEKLASIGELASGVAHEINNPLGVIKCYAKLIAKDQNMDSTAAEDIRIIQKHADQCQNVVASLLSFARVSAPQKIDADLHACIDEILHVLEHQMQKEAIELKKEYLKPLPAVTADAQMMKQVFMNLFMNARQAMPEGGTLSVRTGTRRSARQIAISIEDTGNGISDKFINRIFDPFFTTKGPGKGTGLGLSVSYGIIKQHGGEIEVESTPGRGTTFTVILPTDAPFEPEENKDDGHPVDRR